MAAGVTLKLKRKSGALAGGDLAAGEIGLDTATGDLYVSTDGSTVLQFDQSAIGGEICKVLTADWATTSTTLATVNDGTVNFDFSVAASGVYVAEFFGQFKGLGSTDGYRMDFTGPSSPTLVDWYYEYYQVASSKTTAARATAFSSSKTATAGVNAGGNPLPIYARLTLINGSNAGTVAFQMASEVGNEARIYAGAVFVVKRIS